MIPTTMIVPLLKMGTIILEWMMVFWKMAKNAGAEMEAVVSMSSCPMEADDPVSPFRDIMVQVS